MHEVAGVVTMIRNDVNNIVVLTGAGVSAESGLATFRGPDGLWEGHKVEDVCTPEAYRRDPLWFMPSMMPAGRSSEQSSRMRRITRLHASTRSGLGHCC